MLRALCKRRYLCRSRLAGRAACRRRVGVMGVARKAHHVAHSERKRRRGGSCAAGLCRASCAVLCAACGVVGDIRQLPVLRPFAPVHAGNSANVQARRHLHAVLESGRTFDDLSAADVYADMTGQPDSFTRNNAAEISGHAGTLRNHGVGPKIGNAVGSIGRAAVWLRGVSAPTPKNAFDKAYAVEPVDGRVLIRRRPNHRRSRGLLVVPVICAIARHVRARQGRTETAHDVQRFIVVHNVLQFVDKFRRFHFACSFRVCGSCGPRRGI